MQALTSAQEDYLRAIFVLQEKAGEPARVTQIAKYMGLTKPTVSERLKDLARQKLVIARFYGRVSLTATGAQEAQKLTYKHRLAEVFLHSVLGVPKSQVHAEAHKLEHAFSDRTTSRLAAFLGDPKVDPHGSPIPDLRL